MRILTYGARIVTVAAFLALELATGRPAAAAEQSFDVLQIGTHTYRNVTVTTKSKDYVFLLHSAGMTNVKVAELSPELRETLGYAELPKPKAPATNATAWAKQTIDKLQTSQVKAVEAQVVTMWHDMVPADWLEKLQLPPLTRTLLLEALGVFAAIYLFFCYCCMSLCRKTGQKAGLLVWLPVLKLFPLLRAAGMSRWWFLAAFVPGLNLVAYVVWCVNIAKARSKTGWTAFFMLLPVINWFAFLYLAFSRSQERKRENRRIEILTLETV